MTFLERLKELQDENQLTIIEIAKGAGLPYSTIASYKSRGSIPSMIQLIALANYFGCTVDYLIGRSDDFGNVNVSGRSSEDLTENERRLLEQFRLMPEARQRTVLDMVDGLAESSVSAGGKKRA